MSNLTTKEYNESIKTNTNPFQWYICGRGATKAMRAETVACYIWTVENIVGACTYGDLLKKFKTWSMDTIEAGCKMFNNYKYGF